MPYPKSLQIAVVKEYEQGKPVSTIAAEHGIPRDTIYRWIRKRQTGQTTKIKYSPGEYNMLRMHSEKTDHILEITRISGCITKTPLRRRLDIAETIYKTHREYSVREICSGLEIDRSTFYNHIFRRRDTSLRDEKEKELMRLVQQVYDDSRQSYGAVRITEYLKTKGINVGKRHVLSIMHELGLEAISEGAKKSYEQRREKRVNIIKRNFNTDKPNKVWVSDITYYKCNGKSQYICIIIDLFSRMVVGYKISNLQTKQLVSGTLRQAIALRHPEKGLIFHSDRGSQYLSNSFIKLLQSNNIEQSLSAAGSPVDNAVAESFFSILKKEELYRHDYNGVNEFRKAVGEFIDYYNNMRLHSSLGYVSPMQYEIKHSQQE